MDDYDLVIRGGDVVTATDRMMADVGIRGGRITSLGESLGKGQRAHDRR